MQPLAEVAESSLGQGVVVVLPRELRLDEAARSERLASLDDLLVVRRVVRVCQPGRVPFEYVQRERGEGQRT